MRPTSSGVGDARQPARPEIEVAQAHQHQPQGGIERDGQHRGHDHGEVLGVGQRLEQAAFLRLQRQHGQERDGDHQQREEAGAADLLDGFDDHVAVVPSAAVRSHISSFLCACSTTTMAASTRRRWRWRCRASDMMLAVMPSHAERDEGDQHGHRDGDHRDQGAGNVPEEEQDDQATVTITSMSVCFRLSMERWISSERS